MNFDSVLFILCCFISLICLLYKLKSLSTVKLCIGIFWFLVFFILLYAMLFKSSRGFFVLAQSVLSIILGICILGLCSLVLEKYKNNISITYFLFWYFAIPILSAVSTVQAILVVDTITNIQRIAHCGFLLFGVLALAGLIFWFKKQYKKLKFCFLLCLFYYFPFLFVGIAILDGFEK
ncbi:hypothetical protein [Campylobacter troglodytis]|uniref:hypothetical protein n=1 Tax=Campylobacter troglodytis TaxID=654363 RepID=UPI0011579B1C|nr:hypothetical protein [Campylobacter troglodytis]TQR50218.1 hypothetical protein DMC01_12825 [Campylobacter troglodytis]